jgi:hypothetical protein
MVRVEPDFRLQVRAAFADGATVDVATITGRRARLGGRPDVTPAPLMITTLGRTGSSWVVHLLAQHPSLVAYRPFMYEPRVCSYWAGVLAGLTEPVSYEQLVNPDLGAGAWWLGDHRIRPLRHRFKDADMEEWLSGRSVETLARFCQGQVDGFYQKAASIVGREKPKYFVEKMYPGFEPIVLWDLYPNAREIFLVRDVRDMLCSILAFNRKRGYDSFGRQLTTTDEEFVRELGKTYDDILASWRARSDRAYLLRYEDLIIKPTETLKDVLRYLEVDLDSATIEAMNEGAQAQAAAQEAHRTSASPAGSVGRWKQDLDPELQALCSQVCGSSMSALGYA